MDREEKRFYAAVSDELDRLRTLGAVDSTGKDLRDAMEEAAERAERVAKEARFLQLDRLADEAEAVARSARKVEGHDSLGLFLEALFSFHDRLSGDESEQPEGTTESRPGGERSDDEVGEHRFPSTVELLFDTPPAELFDLDFLERKLILEALDQGERIYSVSARGRADDGSALTKLLYRLEEELNVIRTVGPRQEGTGARMDSLCASKKEREAVSAVLTQEGEIREVNLREVGPERLALSIDRQDLKVSRGVLAGLRKVELLLGSQEYERYTLLQGVLREELREILRTTSDSSLAPALERIERLSEASAESLREGSGRSALELVGRLGHWLESQNVFPGTLRLRVEGGDRDVLESPVAQLTEEAIRETIPLLIDVSGDAAGSQKDTPVELIMEIERVDPYLTFTLIRVSPPFFAGEELQKRLADSSGRYIVEELLSGRLEAVERRNSGGFSLSVPRGGNTMTVLIGKGGNREIAFPAAMVVEAQPLFQRLIAFSADGRIFLRFRGSNLPLYSAAGEAISEETAPSKGVAVVLKMGERSVAVLVDELVSEESVVRSDDAPEQLFVESLGRKIPFFLPVELF